jgi:hypothetical protein
LLMAACRWCDRAAVGSVRGWAVPPIGGRVVMLSDGEQRRLADIESALRADDPRFVHRLESRRPRRRTVLAVVALVVTVMVTVVALVVRSVPLAVSGWSPPAAWWVYG